MGQDLRLPSLRLSRLAFSGCRYKRQVERRSPLNALLITLALTLASCATPAPKIVTRDVLIDRPISCLAPDKATQLLALLPGAMPDRPTDVRQREGIFIRRLLEYRNFADAVQAVLPACVAVPK